MPFDAPFKLGPFSVDAAGRLSPCDPQRRRPSCSAGTTAWCGRGSIRRMSRPVVGAAGHTGARVQLRQRARRDAAAAQLALLRWLSRRAADMAGGPPGDHRVSLETDMPIGLPITAAGLITEITVRAGPRPVPGIDGRDRGDAGGSNGEGRAAPARRSRPRSRPPAGRRPTERPGQRRAAAPRRADQPDCQQGRQSGGIGGPEPQPRQAAERNDRKAAEAADVDGNRQRCQAFDRRQGQHGQPRQSWHQRQLHPYRRRAGNMQRCSERQSGQREAQRIEGPAGQDAGEQQHGKGNAESDRPARPQRRLMAWRAGEEPGGDKRGQHHAGQAGRSWPSRAQQQADQQGDGGELGQRVDRNLGRDHPKPAGDHKPAHDHARPARRRGEQPDAQEPAHHSKPEGHGECSQGPVELLPLGDNTRHPRCVARHHRCVKPALPSGSRLPR